jgi:hypothetical protein
METQSNLLSGLVTPEEYQRSRTNVFPSVQGVRWRMRVDRADLEEAGALLRVAGRHLIEPEKFDKVILSKAQRRSAPT